MKPWSGLSQDWKVRNVLIEMHGNNGSLDGDPPAAMRYTEARLSAISSELLKDIDKETVDFVLNFDETTEEPLVLPSRFPNLLVEWVNRHFCRLCNRYSSTSFR